MSQCYPVNPVRRTLLALIVCLSLKSVFAQPVITSVSPATGPGKMQLVIKGHNFSPIAGHDIVNFGATQGLVLYSGTDSLRVMAPYSSSYQPITVEVDGHTAVAGQLYDQTFSTGGVPFTAASFGAPVNYAVDGNGLSVSDLNLDGKPEIITASGWNAPQFGMRSFSVMNNSGGSGTPGFTTQHFPTPKAPYYCVPADLDGDGRPDLVSWDTAGDGTNEITIYRNNTLSPTIAFDAGVPFVYGTHAYGQPRKLLLQDFDGDGMLDILTEQLKQSSPNNAYYFTVLRNTGSPGHFSFLDSLEFLPANTPGFYPGTLYDYFAQDLDGDGKPDIVAVQGNYVYWYRNISAKGNIAFAAGTALINDGGSPSYFTMGDVDGDGKADLVLSMGGSNLHHHGLCRQRGYRQGRGDDTERRGFAGAVYVYWFR